MAESGVIREFLVGLSFKIDKGGQQSFVSAIETMTERVVGLATAMSVTAATIGIGISRFASNLEQLYFAAQRTGSSATSLKAFQRTAQDFGASAGDAMGSVENLAQSMRMNPGKVALLESLGVHLKRTKDGTYDATDALMQFGNVMRERGYFKPGHFYMAEQYAQMFGINERTLLALRNGKFNEEYARMQHKLHGHGFQKAARDAHHFMVSLRTLETQLEVFGAQVEDAIQKKLGVNLKHLSAWIEQHGPALASQLVTAAEDLYDATSMIARAVGWLLPKFEWLNRESDGWVGKLAALYTVLRLVGGIQVLKGILGLVGGFRNIASSMAGASADAAGLSAVLLEIVGYLGAIGAGIGAGALLDKWLPHNPLAQFGRRLGSGLYKAMEPRDLTAMNYLTSQGWAPWQAAGIVARLEKESSLDPSAPGDHGAAYGIAQWHADRQAEFERVMRKPIQGSSFMEQLKFLNYELHRDPEYGGRMLEGATTAGQAARIFTKYFERPAHMSQQERVTAVLARSIYSDMERKAPYLAQVQANFARMHGAALAHGGAVVHQHTEITVNGARDASQTAHEIGGEQRRVNADLARNLVTGVR